MYQLLFGIVLIVYVGVLLPILFIYIPYRTRRLFLSSPVPYSLTVLIIGASMLYWYQLDNFLPMFAGAMALAPLMWMYLQLNPDSQLTFSLRRSEVNMVNFFAGLSLLITAVYVLFHLLGVDDFSF